MRYRQIGIAVFRVLFGLFFILSTIAIVLLSGGQHPVEVDPEANRFTQALNASGFMNPALIVTFLIGGAAMLFNRSAPIGLILLGAPIFVIAGFHWFLTHSYVWGSIWPIWYVILVWHYRQVFSRLWEPDSAGTKAA
ncbi:hypothetical protein [Novosphingobium sp. CECT 9465]|uniref:hypothetical protein n=1 Tax=Novosphingobium sp. CECT 9465 TaxID=2829794 RepID=UPI001E4E03C4|nr:hypothetical protein [Novosphingobium sp. CECT 9465]